MVKTVFILLVLVFSVYAFQNDSAIEEWCTECVQFGNSTFFKYITYTWISPKYLCSPYPWIAASSRHGTFVDYRLGSLL
jgi:hypothetical protein